MVPSWILGFILFVAVVMAYQPVWHAGFIWDDDVYVTENKLLTSPDGLQRIWFSTDSPSQYFPLVYTSFRLERHLWGLNPAGYHWVNILLHAGNALLLWLLLHRLNIRAAGLAAALFALHPVQVESVAWITERKNILSLFFCLLTLLAWNAFVTRRSQRPGVFYLLALCAYPLALFSKTTACTLPVAMLLLLWLKSDPIDWRRLMQVAPFFILGVGMGLLTLWWERYRVGTSGGIFAMSPLVRLLVACQGVWFYLGKLLWPVHLTFSYPRWIINPADPTAYLWIFVGIILCIALFFARRILGRGPETAALFYLATLSPLLGFVMLYTFRYTFVADHYQYAACIGPLTLFAAGLSFFAARFKGRQMMLEAFSGVVLLIVLGTMTLHQANAYKDVESIWRDTIAKNPGSWLAHSNLGRRLLQKGEYQEAMIEYQEALRINPRDVDTLVFLGNTLLNQGKADEAFSYYERALEINPDNPEAHVNLAVILANRGRTEEAIEHDRKALQLNPKLLGARLNLAVGLVRIGRFEEALEHYRQALVINPNQPLTHINLAIALTALGKTNEASEQYIEAATAVNKHVDTLLQQGRVPEAIGQLTEATHRIPDNAQAHCRLAGLLARQGRREEAKSHFLEALRIQPGLKEAEQGLRSLGE